MNQEKRRAEQLLKHAEQLEQETRLLKKYGYYDEVGRPRTDAEGKRIWEKVQAELRPSR